MNAIVAAPRMIQPKSSLSPGTDAICGQELDALQQQHRDDQGAQTDTAVAASATDDDAAEKRERLDVCPCGGRPAADETGKERAAEAAESPADRLHDQAQSHDVLARG